MAEHLTRSAWDRMMDKVTRPWQVRLDALEAAASELRAVDRNADRLVYLEQQIRRIEDARDLARRDLVELDRRRDLAIERAVEEAGRRARWGRTRKMEQARKREEEWQAEATEATRRTIVSRMATAERELENLAREVQPIALDPTLRDPVLVDWLRLLLGVVRDTQQRDKEARERFVGPWERRRELSLAVAAKLQALMGNEVVTNQAFGEGAIHVVAGSRLAVVEVRDGKGQVRVDDLGTTTTLYEVRPDGDAPLGLVDGSTDRLREATTRVAAATRGRPAPIIVVTGWREAPRVEGGVVLCGPANLEAVLRALPEASCSPSDLAAAAEALGPMPLPTLPLVLPPSLAHLRTIEASDIPLTLPGMRELVEQAHRPQPRAAHSSRERVAA